MKRLLMILLLTACQADTDRTLANTIGRDLAAACPLGDDPADAAARDACANRLGDLVTLRDASREPFVWGGQRAAGVYELTTGTTRFVPRVWRRLYASMFMYGDASTVERVSGQTILHIPVTFRGAMDAGSYPYPFWHSAKKWTAYSRATTLHIVVREGVVEGALRGVAQDPARPRVEREWDGTWGAPRTTLYDYALSPHNPFARQLEHAYRALEARFRQGHCVTCHAPDNRDNAKQLEILVYPAQALAARQDIVDQVTDDLMPPSNDFGIPAGTPATEREELLERARDFASVGDLALAWEGDFRSAVR